MRKIAFVDPAPPAPETDISLCADGIYQGLHTAYECTFTDSKGRTFIHKTKLGVRGVNCAIYVTVKDGKVVDPR